MAINIFQGSKTSQKSTKAKKANSASRSSRVQNALSALTVPAVTSDSGSTAVGKAGTLQKVGKVVGEVAGIASKFLPGIGGTIAKGLNNILNDPEWWRSVPGDAVTLNSPLRAVETGTEAAGGGTSLSTWKPRYAIGEFISCSISPSYVLNTTSTQIANYLMPEIRKVVNAVPLQSATDYGTVLEVNATIYAIWRQLKKMDYMLKHGQTYLASLDDVAFPALQVTNAAWLQSTIGRLEEYLRSHVRLPHTLCEYLAWRFGRVYKSNPSAKSGLILYNVFTMTATIADWDTAIATLTALPSSTVQLQQANTDLFNTYYDHDILVDIPDHTQYTYDWKEFCLRTNLDIRAGVPSSDPETLDCVYIDSSMDNPTTFMASTVSTVGFTGVDTSWLFPVRYCYAYMPLVKGTTTQWYIALGAGTAISSNIRTFSQWLETAIMMRRPGDADSSPGTDDESSASICRKLGTAIACKALDIYNKDVYITMERPSGDSQTPAKLAWDVTALSMDLGTVQSTTLANEHTYAFANLVSVARKRSMSYKEAETLVARDTANFIEKLDVGVSK